MLEELGKNHKLWVKYLIKLGCPVSDCEDIVQDMYIKIYEYLQRHNKDIMYNKDEINYYFIYVTLQNMYYDTLRKKKYDFTDIDNLDFVDEEYTEQDITKEVEAIITWYNSNDAKNVSENEYYKKIFEEVFIEKKSVSELSRESKITYWSLRNAVKIIKKQIQDLI